MSITAGQDVEAALPLAGAQTLHGPAAVRAMQTWFQARNRVTAVFLRAVHTAGHTTTTGGLDTADMFCGDEVAAALGQSRAMASRWLSLADTLLTRLPRVLALMEDGALDDTKARVLADWTADLSGEHTARLLDDVLGVAPGLTVAALIDRIQAVAIALDPEWAARREARAKRRARVAATPNPVGTMTLAGYDLPTDETLEALARVEALAAAVRDRGIRIPIPQLRSVVYLRLLDGFSETLDDATLIRLLVAHLRDHPDNPDRIPPPDTPPDPDDGGPDDGDPDRGGTDGPPHRHPDDPGPDDPGPGAPPPDPRDDAPGDDAAGQDTAEADADGLFDLEPPARGLRRGTVELRLRLSTALGLDRHPGQVPGVGAVTAPTALRLLHRLHHGEWRIVTTTDGHLDDLVLTRHRPHGRPPGPRDRGQRSAPSTPRSRGIVELHVPLALLAALRPDDHPAWEAVIHDARARLDGPRAARDAPDQAGRRRARVELDRWVRTRDRCCVGLGCRVPSRRCELDHTHPWAALGVTAHTNLDALCGHHHRLKHRGGWHLAQPRPGSFTWHTRAGLTYTRGLRRVTEPLPDPMG